MICAIPHAHGDHFDHARGFDPVYMHSADIDLLELMQAGMPEEERFAPQRFTPLCDSSVINLGCSAVRMLHIPGHTAGSVVFADEGHQTVFTGDAIGSGVSVWMQLPGHSIRLAFCTRSPRFTRTATTASWADTSARRAHPAARRTIPSAAACGGQGAPV